MQSYLHISVHFLSENNRRRLPVTRIGAEGGTLSAGLWWRQLDQRLPTGTGLTFSKVRVWRPAATGTGAAAEVLSSSGHLSRQADDLSREVSGFVAGVRAA